MYINLGRYIYTLRSIQLGVGKPWSPKDFEISYLLEYYFFHIFRSNSRRILRKNQARKEYFHSCNECLSREQSVLGLHIKGEVYVFS